MGYGFDIEMLDQNDQIRVEDAPEERYVTSGKSAVCVESRDTVLVIAGHDGDAVYVPPSDVEQTRTVLNRRDNPSANCPPSFTTKRRVDLGDDAQCAVCDDDLVMVSNTFAIKQRANHPKWRHREYEVVRMHRNCATILAKEILAELYEEHADFLLGYAI